MVQNSTQSIFFKFTLNARDWNSVEILSDIINIIFPTSKLVDSLLAFLAAVLMVIAIGRRHGCYSINRGADSR